MPVYVRSLNGIQRLTVNQAHNWVRRVGDSIPNDTATEIIIQTFLTNWNQTYGFLQQKAFLRHLKMYVDQVELLLGICNLGEQIVKAYPPQTYLYVGVGRSPTPLIAYFENIRVRTLTIPLSDFRMRNQNWSITDDILVEAKPQGMQARPRLSPSQRASVFEHFKRYFPSRPVRQRILLIDYTITAHSLVSAQEQLQNFFTESEALRDIEVHALAICRNSDEANVRAVSQRIGTTRSALSHPIDWWQKTGARIEFTQRWHVLPITSSTDRATSRQDLVISAFSGQNFDVLAEYDSFQVLNGNAYLLRNKNEPEFLLAFAALREELQNVIF